MLHFSCIDIFVGSLYQTFVTDILRGENKFYKESRVVIHFDIVSFHLGHKIFLSNQETEGSCMNRSRDHTVRFYDTDIAVDI